MSRACGAGRPAAVRRGALLSAVLLAAWLGLGTAAVRADEGPLPAKTSRQVRGLPRFGPQRDEQARAWCAAALALAARESRARHAGDLYFSVAEVFHRHLRDIPRAARHYGDAAARFDPDDITRGVVLLRWLRLEVERGNEPAAARVRTALEDYLPRRVPRDLDAREAVRWTAWDTERRRDLPRILAAHHEASGRFREAAVLREDLARESAGLLHRTQRVALYEGAARAYHRARMRDEAVGAISAAIELSDDEVRQASLRFWQLYAKHGLLSPDGHPLVTDRWPEGRAFEDDVRGFLRAIQGVPGMGTKYLALGSRAYAARRFAVALEIYLLGARDPSLVAEARRDASVWRGLLMAYGAAVELERFDEAERILEIVERIADEPIRDKDDYLLALAKARRRVAERPVRDAARRKRAAAKQKRAAREAARLRRARIETGEGEARPEPGLEPVADEDGGGVPFLLVLGALLAAYLLAVRIARRLHR